jgi:hypothetical protein
MNVYVALGVLALLFLTGGFYAGFAKRHRDYMIRTLNSPWYVPMMRASGAFLMLVAAASALVIAANCGIDFSWAGFKL